MNNNIKMENGWKGIIRTTEIIRMESIKYLSWEGGKFKLKSFGGVLGDTSIIKDAEDPLLYER